MHKKFLPQVLALGVMVSCSAMAETSSTLSEALTDSDVKLNFRLRYEDVSWDGLEDADALTLRTRLSYQSGSFHGFGLTLEFDDVHALTDVNYRTAGNDPTNPGTVIIPDPEGTEINQSYISYTGLGITARYGRQRIILDNQRFVGGVGWRQNEQTYDAFSVKNTSVNDLSLFYAYVFNVNRIFGEDNPIGDHKHESHLLNVNYAGWGAGTLVGYAYLLDNQNAPGLSSDTLGVRWSGKAGKAFSYNLEYATQSEAGDHPVSYSADYLLAKADYKIGPVSLGAGYELLGSDDGAAAFSTPLATLHAFQGWADRFLDTPVNGVEDIFVSVGGSAGPVKLSATYHQLSSDVGGMDYGDEINVSAATKIGPVTVVLKVADYQADGFGSDTQKIWLMLDSTF
ncbi:MAG TPA: alginate export family protein [Cellvibrionaceae bacterium]